MEKEEREWFIPLMLIKKISNYLLCAHIHAVGFSEYKALNAWKKGRESKGDSNYGRGKYKVTDPSRPLQMSKNVNKFKTKSC